MGFLTPVCTSQGFQWVFNGFSGNYQPATPHRRNFQKNLSFSTAVCSISISPSVSSQVLWSDEQALGGVGPTVLTLRGKCWNQQVESKCSWKVQCPSLVPTFTLLWLTPSEKTVTNSISQNPFQNLNKGHHWHAHKTTKIPSKKWQKLQKRTHLAHL